MGRFEGKGKWAFDPWAGLWLWGAFVVPFSVVRLWIGLSPITTATLALYGAVMACLGVFTIARPVLRAGGYKSWLAKKHIIGGAPFTASSAENKEAEETEKDALAVNIIGPALAIVGTLMNGAGGFY
ncbi:hypothetical protein QN219_30095 [Sinorhizobium sp. 7-81]|uniref:hypothetical protein n=1 Tax=Sinorhizobium sp. 8-89 TaxID=3049089 RepID=UPI0024C32F0C|nr:hypothetical protein [Sinorhizobium sp. 8-89]MDK1494221.1 hypothetical protein [Sinorhizobium sp. 8-89]